jgi:hypothetical protein
MELGQIGLNTTESQGRGTTKAAATSHPSWPPSAGLQTPLLATDGYGIVANIDYPNYPTGV